MLMTTSGTSCIFSKVCLVVLFLSLREGEKITIGGLIENRLKKLNGDKFTLPFASMLLTKAMGRGAMAYCRKFCACWVVISCRLISIFSPQRMRVNRAFAEFIYREI